jgi:hypothetical protein
LKYQPERLPWYFGPTKEFTKVLEVLTVKVSAELISSMKDWVNHSVTCGTLLDRLLTPHHCIYFMGTPKGIVYQDVPTIA